MKMLLGFLVATALGCGGRMCTRKIFDRLEIQRGGHIPGGNFGGHDTIVPVEKCIEWTEADGGITYVPL